MKYMGSKRAMLTNGLGHLISREIVGAKRFIDLFSGSGAVSKYAACRHAVEVLAFDLQEYSKILAGAVIGRSVALNAGEIERVWIARASEILSAKQQPPKYEHLSKAVVEKLRLWCARQTELPITVAYGGHYFSPIQAMWIDALLVALPSKEGPRTSALAALIAAASQCAAAPGHTAQPFQPTVGAKRYLQQSWSIDILSRVRTALHAICGLYAIRRGVSAVADANEAAKTLRQGDLAFLDPPYSGVHYSRFYHVLESIARGRCSTVMGIGRYPPPIERPRSRYSMLGESIDAMDDLLAIIASRGARAIVTFPDHDCSNGLSGEIIRELSAEHFRVRVKPVESKFSTMGGTKRSGGVGRGGRHYRDELILVLDPK